MLSLGLCHKEELAETTKPILNLSNEYAIASHGVLLVFNDSITPKNSTTIHLISDKLGYW